MVGSVNIWLAAAFIGICTCLLSALGVKIGNVFGSRYEKRRRFAGGVILILLGVNILLEHLGGSGVKRTKRRMTLCSVLLLCNLVFIWGNSLLPAEVSGQISGTLKALLDGVFTPAKRFPPAATACCEICPLCRVRRVGTAAWVAVRDAGKKRLPAFALGVAAACIDETIRSSSRPQPRHPGRVH